jgi:formate hydrogenlyase subunit 3/multisubunit Na+/H+ antiporter MnhD subunit
VIGITESLRPWLAIACPGLGAILILLSNRLPNVRESWTLLASVAQFSIIFSLVPMILEGAMIESYLFTMFPGIHFGFRVDAFGLIFAMTSSFLWILVSIYSIGYMRTLREHAQTRYYFCFALAIFGAVGVALSGNLVTMFVFYEILTLSTYPLVAHEETPEALFAGRKYLTYLFTAGCFLLGAAVLTYSLVGTSDFNRGGILTMTVAPRSILIILFVLFLLGFMKAAYMPFHSWLPTAMVAPTPVSALLHAVAVVKAGVFGIVRTVCYIYGIDLMGELGLGLMLASFAAFTMITASLFAIAQDNLKRRLAYSTISQLSYIILGVALLSPMGIMAAMIHIPFHGVMKITLFLCAGSILVASKKENISEMAGIGRTMPITMLAFTVGALGMCGSPLTGGFISKWFLGLGTVQAGNLAFLVVLLSSSWLDVVYFFPIVYTAFFGNSERMESSRGRGKIREAPLPMVIPVSITALLSIIFYFPNPLTDVVLNLVRMAIRNLGG